MTYQLIDRGITVGIFKNKELAYSFMVLQCKKRKIKVKYKVYHYEHDLRFNRIASLLHYKIEIIKGGL